MKTNRPKPVLPEMPGDEAPITVRVEQLHGVAVVRLTGEIDLNSISAVESALDHAVAPNGMGLVVDLTNVSYFNSATIKLLFNVSERLQRRGQQLRVTIGDTGPMRKVLSLVNFDRLVPLDQTVEEAQTRITAGGRRS